MLDKGTLRVIDANFNRCKEGLRVVEDIFRFILLDENLRKKIRKLRHSLDQLSKSKVLKSAICSRDSKNDLGKPCDHLEIKRRNVTDLLYVNFQRVKESLRVLEEFFKLINRRQVSTIKKLRYEIYTLEKQTILKWSSLHNPQSLPKGKS